MSRSKKSRKVGQIGIPKAQGNSTAPKRVANDSKPKKRKGLAAGSRHNQEKPRQLYRKTDPSNSDPRIGSKKPISLIATASEQRTAKRFKTPQEELKSLEQDTRLNKLLDKLDSGAQLTFEEQLYVDNKMDRHRILCELLGIQDSEEAEAVDEPESDSELDLLAKLDSIDTTKMQ